MPRAVPFLSLLPLLGLQCLQVAAVEWGGVSFTPLNLNPAYDGTCTIDPNDSSFMELAVEAVNESKEELAVSLEISFSPSLDEWEYTDATQTYTISALATSTLIFDYPYLAYTAVPVGGVVSASLYADIDGDYQYAKLGNWTQVQSSTVFYTDTTSVVTSTAIVDATSTTTATLSTTVTAPASTTTVSKIAGYKTVTQPGLTLVTSSLVYQPTRVIHKTNVRTTTSTLKCIPSTGPLATKKNSRARRNGVIDPIRGPSSSSTAFEQPFCGTSTPTPTTLTTSTAVDFTTVQSTDTVTHLKVKTTTIHTTAPAVTFYKELLGTKTVTAKPVTKTIVKVEPQFTQTRVTEETVLYLDVAAGIQPCKASKSQKYAM